ncbi:unnamed protein product [Diplocarpon coronariae]
MQRAQNHECATYNCNRGTACYRVILIYLQQTISCLQLHSRRIERPAVHDARKFAIMIPPLPNYSAPNSTNVYFHYPLMCRCHPPLTSSSVLAQ